MILNSEFKPCFDQRMDCGQDAIEVRHCDSHYHHEPLLKINQEDVRTNLSIKNFLQRGLWTNIFLHSVFLNYPAKNQFTSRNAYITMVVYIILLLMLMAAMLYVMYLFAHPGDIITDGPVADAFVISCQILELIGVPLAIYFGSKHLDDNVVERELETYSNAAIRCLSFDAIFLLFVLYGYCLLPNFGTWFYISVVFFEWAGTIGITISLFHVIIDARASVKVLTDLCSHVDADTITLSMVRDAEDLLRCRSQRNMVLNSFIAVSAVLHSITCILYVLVTVDDRSHTTEYRLGVAAVATAYFLKEVFYLILALMEISVVNDLADSLTRKLAVNEYPCDNDDECCFAQSRAISRTCIYNRLCAQPLSFYLLLTRPTTRKVIFQAIGYFFTLSISIALKIALKF